MENAPITPSYEAPAGGPEHPTDDKKDKKKKKSPEAILFTDAKKIKAERDIAKSLDKMSLFETAEPPKSKAEKLDTKLFVTKEDQATGLEASAEDAPVDTLSETETRHAQKEIAEAHLAELEAVKSADPNTADELKPAEVFLEKVDEGEEPTEAFRDTAGELGMSEPEITAALNEADEDVPDEPAEEGSEPTPAELTEGEIDLSPDLSEDEDEEEQTAAPPPGRIPPPPSRGSGGGAGGPGNRGSGGSTPGAGIPQPQPQFNRANQPPQPAIAQYNMMPTSTAYYLERCALNDGLLIGGILGYLIGRRRGRIKTEKRLLPVQRKLEKQVKTMERDIAFRERQLIGAAQERKAAKRSKAEAAPAYVKPETPKAPLRPERTQPSRVESRLQIKKPERAEKLGHLVVAAEAPERIRIEYRQPNNIRQAFRPEHIKTMHRRELLELSEKVLIEGASLRSIYETHLIGEKQLRHLLGNYLEGKDIRHELRRAMIEREIDFERDPMLRDRVRTELSQGNQTLQQMLKKAGALPEQTNEHEARAEREAERAAARRDKKQHQRKVADRAMVTAIIVLAAVVVALLLH